MLNINIKERPIYKIFCYISMAYIVGAALWALWISKFMAFAIIPVSALLIFGVYWISQNNIPKTNDYFDVLSEKDKKVKKKISNFISWLLFFVYTSAVINGMVISHKSNYQLFYFFYIYSAILLGVIEAWNDITYSTRVNASSTFFKENTAKRELILKTFIFISLTVILIKLNISLEKLISNDEVLINAMFIGGFVSFFYVLAMVISNLTTAYYVMIFKKELFKEIIKKETGKK